jgi:hypothetical protein
VCWSQTVILPVSDFQVVMFKREPKLHQINLLIPTLPPKCVFLKFLNWLKFTSWRNDRGGRNWNEELCRILFHIVISKHALEFNLCLYKPRSSQSMAKQVQNVQYFKIWIENFLKSQFYHFSREQLSMHKSWNYVMIKWYFYKYWKKCASRKELVGWCMLLSKYIFLCSIVLKRGLLYIKKSG